MFNPLLAKRLIELILHFFGLILNLKIYDTFLAISYLEVLLIEFK